MARFHQQKIEGLQISPAEAQLIRTEYFSRNFMAFRKRLAEIRNDKFIEGWWQREIAEEITQFKAAYYAGRRPMLMIKSPPQHGKSFQIIDAITWMLGADPNLRTIFTSYSDRLGVRANLHLQRAMIHEKFRSVFPNCIINPEVTSGVKIGRPQRNKQMIEFWGARGSFRNTTIGGPITGEGLDLGLIDDFLKGREEANSETTRQKKWDWFTDDFFTRFADHAGVIVIGTNWHVDDPMQRMIDKFPEMRVVSYPAIAVHDEKYRKAGEPLFPELKSLEFLLQRKRVMPEDQWQSLYQQDPTLKGGNLFKDHMIELVDLDPNMEFDYEFCVADTSYKEKQHNDPTCITHFGSIDDDLYVIDVWMERIKADEAEGPLMNFLKPKIKWTYRTTLIEPKGHGIYLNGKLRKEGLMIPPDKDIDLFFKDRRLDKVERANNAIPHLSYRKLRINKNLRGSFWDSNSLVSQLLKFPKDKHDDFVDTVVDGLKQKYGTTGSILDYV